MKIQSHRVASKKGAALFDAVPTAALLNLGFRDREVGLYSILRLESATGLQVIEWDGERIGLPRYTGAIRVRDVARKLRADRDKTRRSIQKLARYGFISIKRSSKKYGLIYEVKPLDSIPTISLITRAVKPSGEDAASVGNDFEKLLSERGAWPRLLQQVRQCIVSQPIETKEFFDFLLQRGAPVNAPLSIPTDLSTDFATQGVNSLPVGSQPFSDAVAPAAANAAEDKNGALIARPNPGQVARTLSRSTSQVSAQPEVSPTANAVAKTGEQLSSGGSFFSEQVRGKLWAVAFKKKSTFKAEMKPADVQNAIVETEKELLKTSPFDFLIQFDRVEPVFLNALGLIMYTKSPS